MSRTVPRGVTASGQLARNPRKLMARSDARVLVIGRRAVRLVRDVAEVVTAIRTSSPLE